MDGSVESAAALRWACREASLRNAEVHAVHVREAKWHGSPATPGPRPPGREDTGDADGTDLAGMWRSVVPERGPCPEVAIRTEVVDGLAARELLDRAVAGV